MPPAFNLSQDQTLQFNPKHSQFTDGRIFTSTSMDLSIRVIALILFCNLRRFASRHPHLSVVQIFKDHRRAVSFDSSAAERRDYEELLTSRQALNRFSFTSTSSPLPPENSVSSEGAELYTHQKQCQEQIGNITQYFNNHYTLLDRKIANLEYVYLSYPQWTVKLH